MIDEHENDMISSVYTDFEEMLENGEIEDFEEAFMRGYSGDT